MVTKHDIPKNIIAIGPGRDIEIEGFSLHILFDQKKIVTDQPIYFNYNLTKEKVINFEYGDIIGIGGVDIWLEERQRVEFSYEKKGLYTTKLADVTTIKEGYPDEPFYTNSPFVYRELFTDKVDLETPPEKEKKMSKGDIAKQLIPAILSIVIMILMLKIRPRGIRGYLMALTSVTSFAISMINVYQTRKEAKEHNKNRTKIYTEYLWEKRYELNQIIADNSVAQNYNHPKQLDLIKLIETYTFRLYERDSRDSGYLKLRLGRAEVPSHYEINNPFEKIKLTYEPLEEELKELYERYKVVKNTPLVIDGDRNIGLVGSRHVIMQQIHSILMQYYVFQSYLDLNLILITQEEYQKDFEYLRYLRHVKNPYTNFNNFIIDAKSRDQLLNSYTQILRQRQQEYKQGMKFSPHLLFLIDNSKLVSNHPIMEFLQADEDLGITLIYIAQDERLLPKHIDTIVRFVTETSAEIVMENKKLVNLEFELEPVCNDLNKLDQLARHIARLEHIKGVKSSIPEKLGFLEMFEVTNVLDLNIKDRWATNHAYDSLACRIGKKSETDYVELNLHEKAHGPHGLVAGTTGSGKSEVIQTYILSLALNYSPYDVGFLLIDYKGGGMANLFKNLPHHLGSITNLDGYQSMRALASIKSELKRRQQIFSDVDVNHINQYHKLLEAKKVVEPLPHLFLISDEFAELKSEQPDFMKELVSAARIGRSLGIHLILATQKPTGVVDEQIWSNSKFKLCLKVAEESDSKELLKTPDAAYITEAGRG